MKRRGNTSAVRGRGYRSRLTPEEQDALGEIASSHGYEDALIDGLTLRAGVVFSLAVLSGEVATVLLNEDERWHAIRLLLEAHDSVLRNIGAQLRHAAEREATA